MAVTIPVYCEFEQLKRVFSRKFDEIEPSQELIGYAHFKRFLFSHADLYLDLSQAQIIEKFTSDILVKTLLKKSTSGGAKFLDCVEKIKLLKAKPEKYLEMDESAVYLLEEKPNIDLTYASFIIQSNLSNSKILQTHSEPQILTRGEVFNWSKFLGKHLYSRYLFIQDNYMIENLVEEKSESFQEIINAFISKYYIGQFDLYILHFIDDEKILNAKEVLINKIFKKLNLKCKWNIQFHKGRTDELHDRNFVTNYCVVNSGHSTDFLKSGKLRRHTTLNYHHIIKSPDYVKPMQERMFALLRTTH